VVAELEVVVSFEVSAKLPVIVLRVFVEATVVVLLSVSVKVPRGLVPEALPTVDEVELTEIVWLPVTRLPVSVVVLVPVEALVVVDEFV
jgi:hypothetical protein